MDDPAVGLEDRLDPDLAEARPEDLAAGLAEDRLDADFAEARPVADFAEDARPEEDLADGFAEEDRLEVDFADGLAARPGEDFAEGLAEERLEDDLAAGLADADFEDADFEDEEARAFEADGDFFVSPASARSLFTVRAAISSARPFWPRFS